MYVQDDNDDDDYSIFINELKSLFRQIYRMSGSFPFISKMRMEITFFNILLILHFSDSFGGKIKQKIHFE